MKNHQPRAGAIGDGEGYCVVERDGIILSYPFLYPCLREESHAAFGLGCSRNLRTASASAFGIKEDDIDEDCCVIRAIAHRLQPLQHGTPCETHVQKKAKTTPQEVEISGLAEDWIFLSQKKKRKKKKERGRSKGVTSLWHTVRLVLQCSSPPLIYPAWVLPSPFYDPSMISFLHLF